MKMKKGGRPFLDLTGKKIGRWTVIKKTKKRSKSCGSVIWQCKCDCGNIKNITSVALSTKGSSSCGCFKHDFFTRRKHITPNRKKQKNNSSGYIGICYTNTDKYQARIKYKNKSYSLGYYDFIEDAIWARNNFIIKNKLHEEYKIQTYVK